MAKKAKKKAAKKTGKAAKKTAKATGKKGSKKAGKKSAKKAGRRGGASVGPFDVRTGRGSTPGEIGKDLVASFNTQTPDEQIWKKWFSPQIVSIEGHGQGWRGTKGLKAKSAEFHQRFVVHNARAEGPYVGGTGFAVKFTMEMEDKTTGERHSGTEVGVYTVKNGKIVQEEFMYGNEASSA